jgi:hypothetical protein
MRRKLKADLENQQHLICKWERTREGGAEVRGKEAEKVFRNPRA